MDVFRRLPTMLCSQTPTQATLLHSSRTRMRCIFWAIENVQKIDKTINAIYSVMPTVVAPDYWLGALSTALAADYIFWKIESGTKVGKTIETIDSVVSAVLAPNYRL